MIIPKQSNIVGYWKGNLNQNGTLQDFSDNGNHGTLVSAPPQVETPYGSALDFDGSADYVVIGQPSVLDFTPGTDAFTCSILLKTTSDGMNVLAKRNNTLADSQYAFVITSVTGNIASVIGGTSDVGSISLTDGVWHVATWVITTTEISYYVDGEFDTTGSIGTATNAYDVLIGARRGADNTDISSPFDGLLLNTIIWNIALNPNEVKQLYQAMQRLTAKRL